MHCVDSDVDDYIDHLDPDRDDVPPELLAHEGQQVLLWVDGEPPMPGTLVICPQFWAHARRLEEGLPPGPTAN
jgi:hypothetical protein